MGFQRYECSRPSVCVVVVVVLPPPPTSSPPHHISKSSWTCFDPSLINNLITPRSRQLSTRAHPGLSSLQYSSTPGFRLARSPPLFACEVQMSTQPPNPQLMGRTNVAMAVAQQKSKPAAKPNSTPKGKMQMHRRSRTGLLDFTSTPVTFLTVAAYPVPPD
jgi:hypothetical protein